MKTYKKGISLIVLVITIIVLAILAATVIIQLSNTNIIENASETKFKNDMASYKEAYELYVASELIEDRTFDRTTLNVTSSDAEFTEIFGNNVSDNYKEKLQVMNGKLVYKTMEADKVEILEDLGMAVKITPVSEISVGDLVSYTPTASPTGTYSGATYVMDTNTASSTYNTYIESTTNYTPGTLKWVYLGQDENGNTLLTSREATSFTVTIAGQDGWVTGPDRLDTLCNTLYGNSTYGTVRNMKIEDVNRVLEYDGPLGFYYDQYANEIDTDEPMTFGEIAGGKTMSNRTTPRLSATAFEDYLSNGYRYIGTDYKANTTNEYKVIFKKANGTTNQSWYWLSSVSAYVNTCDDTIRASGASFGLRNVYSGEVRLYSLFSFLDVDVDANGEERFSYALRPVVILKSNIQFGEKNASGEWTLVAM